MEDRTTKWCSRCQQDKDLAEFSKRAASKDGLQNHCRACVSIKNRRYHSENREQRVAYMADRYDRLHEHELERSRRYRQANPEKVLVSARNYYQANIEACRANARVRMANARANWSTERREAFLEYLKVWTEQNRERVREHARAWRQANPEFWNEKSRRRRALKLAATVVPFTLEQLAQRMSMFAGCWMCGGPKECVDHVKPLSKRGAHCLANLAAACTSCNTSKSDSWHGPRETIRRFRRRALVSASLAA